MCIECRAMKVGIGTKLHCCSTQTERLIMAIIRVICAFIVQYVPHIEREREREENTS